MDIVTFFIDFILHLDQHLKTLVQDYGVWIYGILFLIIFCETGLVVTPFLPGDSLLFVAGTLAGSGLMDPTLLTILLIIAAILGDSVNYAIGRKVGPAVFRNDESRFFKRKYLHRTEKFYDKYGAKTIIIARFIPIVRTFAPFVAGIGAMSYTKFLFYNVVGGIVWVCLFIWSGYFLGHLTWVKSNLTAVIFGIIILSIMPAIVEYIRHRRQVKKGIHD